MANIATVIAMTPNYRPFERPPDPVALWSMIPRGLRGFIVNTGLLDASGSGDTQTLDLTATLSPSFAYVFADISLTIAQNRATVWEDKYTLNLQNWYQGQLALSSDFTFQFGGIIPVDVTLADRRGNGVGANDSVPRAPMWAPKDASGILINIRAVNENQGTAAAGTVNAYINFWEFDLEQIRKYPINAPLPVHSR